MFAHMFAHIFAHMFAHIFIQMLVTAWLVKIRHTHVYVSVRHTRLCQCSAHTVVTIDRPMLDTASLPRIYTHVTVHVCRHAYTHVYSVMRLNTLAHNPPASHLDRVPNHLVYPRVVERS